MRRPVSERAGPLTLWALGSQMVREPSWEPDARQLPEAFQAQLKPASSASAKLLCSTKPAPRHRGGNQHKQHTHAWLKGLYGSP